MLKSLRRSDSSAAWLADEEMRRRIFLTWGLALALLLTLFMAPFDGFVAGNRADAIFESLMALSAALLLYSLRRWRNVSVIALGTVMTQGGLLLAIITIDGMKDLALVWLYVLPPIAFFLLGVRRGGLVTALFYFGFWGSIGLDPQGPQWLTLTGLGMFNLLLSSITVMALVALYEFTRVASHRALLHAANNDFLTSAVNRRAFEREFDREVARASRQHSPLALLIIDIDLFKQINDRYGHDVGDQALIEMVRRLQGCLRASDLFGRLGGEEFGILLPDTALSEAVTLAERLRRAMADRPLLVGGGEIPLTISLGIAPLSADAPTATALYSRADQALLTAKRNGRNRVEVAGRADAERATDEAMPAPLEAIE